MGASVNGELVGRESLHAEYKPWPREYELLREEMMGLVAAKERLLTLGVTAF